MKQNPVVKTIEALEARVHFGAVMEEVERTNTRILVNKRGKPKLIMLSVNDYLENIVKEDILLTQVHLQSKAAGLDQITEQEIDAEIKATRMSQAVSKKRASG
jgi:prevent-host-death family protein